jgi:CubicO group peptidase (beta-lactamase class C family)
MTPSTRLLLTRYTPAALALWLAGCAATGSPAPSAAPPALPAASVAAQGQRVLEAWNAAVGFSGAVVLMRNNQVLYAGAVGLARRGPDLPFTVDTPSDGASLAKTFTAAAVFQAVASGQLAWDEPVQRLVPEYPHPGVKLRHLLNHRNGLPDYDALDKAFEPGQVRDTSALLRATSQLKLAPTHAPGAQFEYSNIGFDVAALMLERSSGQHWESWLRSRYFDRLGLQGLAARPARQADWKGPRTLGYRQRQGSWELFDVFDGEGFYGASNFYGSAHDWARWGAAFADGRVLPPAQLDAGLRTPLFESGLPSQLNQLSWYCDTALQRCYYTGNLNAFHSLVYWDRERREVVAFVSNSTLHPWQAAVISRDFVATLAGRPLDADLAPTATSPAAAAPAAGPGRPGTTPQFERLAEADLPAVAGSYLAPGLGRVTLSLRDKQLHIRVGQGEETQVFRVTRQQHYSPALDLTLGFTGPPQARRLHLLSVFHHASAARDAAARGP